MSSPRNSLARLATFGVIAALALAGCSSSDGADDQAADTRWSYTSGDGKTISLDQKPERIIAAASEATGLIARGITPVGIYLNQEIKYTPELKGVDLDGIEIVGDTWGKIDAEKVAELRPDLIVADYWPAQKAYQGFEEGADADSMKVAKLAPVIGASQQGSLEAIVDWYDGFAESLGKPVDPADKATFEEAKASFEAAVEAKPGLTALAIAPDAEKLYVGVPEYSTSLTDFKNWGLDVTDPMPDKGFPYWETISWENADKYQTDLLLIDDRTLYDDPETVTTLAEEVPTWTSIKAAEAKAYAAWPGFWVHTWADYATSIDAITKAIDKADENLT